MGWDGERRGWGKGLLGRLRREAGQSSKQAQVSLGIESRGEVGPKRWGSSSI